MASSSKMHLTAVFAVLFRISYGLIPHSELDQVFLDLKDGNVVEFYDGRNSSDSKPNKLDENTQKEPIFISFLKKYISSEKLNPLPVFGSKILEDFSRGITGKKLYDNIFEDTLETVEGKTDDVLNHRIWEDSLDIIDEKIGESMSGKSLLRKPRATIQDKITEITAETVVENAEMNEESNCTCKSVVTSFPRVPAVFTFVNTFIETVQSSELLTTLFNITDATPEQFQQYKYRFIVDFLRRSGYNDANLIAAFAVRHMTKYFNTLLPQAMIQIYGNYMADFMFAEGHLIAGNAEELSLMYCRILEEYAKLCNVTSKSGYSPKFQAITEGETCFFLQFGDLSYSESWQLSFYYAHEWLLAALYYGTLKDLIA